MQRKMHGTIYGTMYHTTHEIYMFGGTCGTICWVSLIPMLIKYHPCHCLAIKKESVLQIWYRNLGAFWSYQIQISIKNIKF